MADVEKTTNRQWLELIDTIIDGSSLEDKEGAHDFVARQIKLLDNKATKAAERAAKKKAEGDELRAAVQAVLTTEYVTADDITAQIEGEDVSKSKVTNRLGQLVAAGIAEKMQVKVDGRKLMAYRLAAEDCGPVDVLDVE